MRWPTPLEGALVVALAFAFAFATRGTPDIVITRGPSHGSVTGHISLPGGFRGTETGGIIRSPAGYIPPGMGGPRSFDSGK
jgi:hypothetical protein